MALFKWQKSKEEESQMTEEEKAEAAAQQKKIDDAAKAAAELPEIKTKLNALDKLTQWVDEQKAQKKKDDDAAAARKAADDKNKSDEELEELFLTDPKKAVEVATKGQQQLILTLRADNIKREVFEDAEKYKYYHGDFKKKVDALLANQTLAAKNDPTVVENCYKSVLADHMDDIIQGKLKARFAQGTTNTNGTDGGKAGGDGGKKEYQITDDIKKLAKQFGMKPEEYAEALDKEGIGYV